MSVQDKMNTHFTLYPRSTLLRQVVDAIKAQRTEFYFIIQDGTAFMVTTLPVLKSKLVAITEEFGETALTLTLADIDNLWTPQVPLSLDSDERVAMDGLRPGESAPVIESGQAVGVFALARRSLGSSALDGLYGPRFALFSTEKPKGAAVPSTRTCPHCGKQIDYYKPKRVGGKIEPHCPHCDFLIIEVQP